MLQSTLTSQTSQFPKMEGYNFNHVYLNTNLYHILQGGGTLRPLAPKCMKWLLVCRAAAHWIHHLLCFMYTNILNRFVITSTHNFYFLRLVQPLKILHSWRKATEASVVEGTTVRNPSSLHNIHIFHSCLMFLELVLRDNIYQCWYNISLSMSMSDCTQILKERATGTWFN